MKGFQIMSIRHGILLWIIWLHTQTSSTMAFQIPMEKQIKSILLRKDGQMNLDGKISSRQTNNKNSIIKRRDLFHQLILSNSILLFGNPSKVNSIPFLSSPPDDRRQLELCIVTLIRTKYWAQGINKSIRNGLDTNDTKKTMDAYIEARLGSKAILTKKKGDGSNANVYRLSSFELRECLKDAVSYCTQDEKEYKKIQSKKSKKDQDVYQRFCPSRKTEELAQDIVESFAACLEFDGLDNLTDVSPRSSLMKSQFNNEKAAFVERMLKERAVPSINAFLDFIFQISSNDTNQLQKRCYQFIQLNYSSEIPMELQPSISNDLSDTSTVTTL